MAPFVQTRKYLTDTHTVKKWKKNASCNCANLRKLFATTYIFCSQVLCSVLCLTRWLAALDSNDDPTTLTDLPLTTITTVTATRVNQVVPPNSSWWFISTAAQLTDTPRTLTEVSRDRVRILILIHIRIHSHQLA